jgi:Lamin Tail Domain
MDRIRLSLIVLATTLLLIAPAAQGASPDLVISQVYAGGGNAGATFANDYVELFNRGSSTIDLTGWSVQYAPATSTSWSPTTLAGSVAPGRRYLVQFASAGTVGSPLPTADATGRTNFAASGGKIAIVHDTAALTCGAAPGSCSAIPAVHDLIGYGTATDFESAAAAALSSTTAAVRDGNSCTDTDSNDADFTATTPVPHNSSTAAAVCGGTPTSFSQSASVAVDVQSAISLTLERSSLSFGSVAAGQTPAAVSERVTVASNGSAGYSLSVHRAAFTPADLPLGISAAAPTGAQLAAPLAGGAVVAVPIAPAADLLLGTTSAASVAGGDIWPTSFSFTPALPSVPAGHYATSVTYTVIGR